jgi:Carboxypeptidase regulatory-like domain/TonB dependent receptor
MHKLLARLACVLLLSACAALWAQSVGGTLSGRITAANGNPVPHAAITITNAQTNTSVKALTGPDGTFSIAGLPPGTYRVSVESAGYKRASQQNLELTTTGPAVVNITLEVGNSNETVEIKGTAPMTQTDNGEVSVAIDSRPVHEIPVIDRNHQELVEFETGITPPLPELPFWVDPDQNRFYSTNGQFPFLNQNYLDGVWNQEPYRDTAVRVVPEEMIQQFNISTANLTMDKGFTGGAYVVDNSRGGTNAIHGDAFEFYSGNPLRTRSYFDTINSSAPLFVYNQFGVAVGGPIIKDKLFFFGSYEGNYDQGANTQLSTVPIPGALTGNLSSIPGLSLYNPFTGTADGFGRAAFAGNIIPASMINPTAAAIASFIPSPNLPGLANNYLSNTPYQLNYQKGDGRIDYHMSDHTSAFLRYGYSNNYANETSPLGDVIGAGNRDRLIAQNAEISVDHAFGDNLITDLRFGYNRYDSMLNFYSNTTPLAADLGVASISPGLVGVGIPGMPFIGSTPFSPENPVDNTFNWVWNWGWHTSKHSFKWGVDIRRIRADGWQNNPYFPFGANGAAYFGPGPTLLNNGVPLSTYSELYNSLAGFLLGTPSQEGAISYLTTPTIRQSQYGVWIGDNIHLLHHLTVDIGARYEVFGALEPMGKGGAQYYDPATNTFNYAGLGGVSEVPSVTQTSNIAPRVGLAYSLNDRTVIRAGYGIQYFQMPYMLSGFMAPETGGLIGIPGTYEVAPLTGVFGPTLPSSSFPTTSIVNGQPAGSLPATIISRNLPTPYVQTFSLQVQRDFYYGSVFSIGYVGMLDRHLPGDYNLNYALPGTGVAGLPFAALGQISPVMYFENGMTANYNSLQVSLNKRFSQGFAFMAAYSYSKALGYTDSIGQLLDPLDRYAYNYGPMNYDRQQVFNLTHLWEIPWGRNGNGIMATLLGGWQLNGVLSWYTGEPLNFTADPLLCNCPGLPVLAGATGTASSLVTGNYGIGQSFFNNSAFYEPVNSNVANLTRGVLRGPDSWTYNLALLKNFHFHERFNFQVRAEAYNLANTARPANPITNINSPAFGQINTLVPEGVPGAFGREVKFGGLLQF